MERFTAMKVENVHRPEGELAKIHPDLLIRNKLDRIGLRDLNEKGFGRRAVKLAGFDLGHGFGANGVDAPAYSQAVNQLISVWNSFDSEPDAATFEQALHAHLGMGK